MISYILAMRQVEESARHEVENLVYQTGLYIDNRFQAILEQMTALAGDPVLMRLLNCDPGEITPADYLKVQSHVDTVRLYNSSIIDTVYINLNHGQFRFFRGDDDYTAIVQQYQSYARTPESQDNEIHWQSYQVLDKSAMGADYGLDVYRLIGRGNAKQDGILLFRLRRDFLVNIFNRPILGGQGYLTLISNDETVITGNVPQDM